MFGPKEVPLLQRTYNQRVHLTHSFITKLSVRSVTSPGYTRCFDRTSVYFCASPLQNFAVPHDFYCPLSISLEWSGWPRIWCCGIGGFQGQVQCLFVGLVALSFFVFNYFPLLFFSSIGWECWAGVFGLIGCQSPSPGLALPIFFNNNNKRFHANSFCQYIVMFCDSIQYTIMIYHDTVYNDTVYHDTVYHDTVYHMVWYSKNVSISVIYSTSFESYLKI